MMQQMQRWRRMVAAGVVLAGSAACTSLNEQAGDTAASRDASAAFAWHDLVTLDAEAARAFYAGVFGWTFAPSGVEGYDWIRHGEEVIGGMVDAAALPEAPRSSGWISGIAVDDVASTLTRAEAAGATVLRSPLTLPVRGTYAVMEDRGGAVVQLVSGNPYAVTSPTPKPGRWLWTERLSGDPEAAVGFYAEVFEWEAIPATETYRLLQQGEVPKAGVVANPFDGTPPGWIPFVRVGDPAALMATVRDLGGRVVLEPSPGIRDGHLALILDPGGAAVALQTWNADEEDL